MCIRDRTDREKESKRWFIVVHCSTGTSVVFYYSQQTQSCSAKLNLFSDSTGTSQLLRDKKPLTERMKWAGFIQQTTRSPILLCPLEYLCYVYIYFKVVFSLYFVFFYHCVWVTNNEIQHKLTMVRKIVPTKPYTK